MTRAVSILVAALVAATALPVVTAGQGSSVPQPDSKAPAARALVKDVRREVLPEVVRVTIELDSEVAFHDERIDGPPRVFLDLRGTRAAANLVDRTIRFDGDTAPVHQIRLGRPTDGTTRIVLEAADVPAYNVYQLYNPYRLVIDCARSGPVPPPPPRKLLAAGPAPLPVRQMAALFLRTAPDTLPAARLAIADALSPHVDPRLTAAAVDAPAPPHAADVVPATRGSRFSVARQLGLGVSRIVIDPGHGGHDPGAQYGGVSEAEVVLDVALRLEKLLQKVTGTNVVLTRRTDEFVALQERTAIANHEEADLFLSIHGNANASPEVRGIETYVLNFANTLSARAVAARENAASGQAMAALPDFVKAIALNNKLEESREFAGIVQRAMVDKLRTSNKTVKDLGVKQAPFVVLIGAAMPSVLAEISFVTNPQDAKLLKTPAYRARIAEALFNAIQKYQASLRNVTTVAARPDN